MNSVVAILTGIPCTFSPYFSVADDIIDIETMTGWAEQCANTAAETTPGELIPVRTVEICFKRGGDPLFA